MQSLWKTIWRVLEKLQKLPYDPATQLLGIYSDKTLNQKDACTPVFIAVLFTITKTWKQSKCSLTEEWIKIWYIYNGILVKIKNEIMSFAATWMDLEIITLSKVSLHGVAKSQA